MNSASAMGTVWTVIAMALSFGSAVALVALGIRRCHWSIVKTGPRSWRVSGFLVGVGLVATAVATVGLVFSDAATRLAVASAAICAGSALALWAWCMWTDRAPVGELIPGRYTTVPHRAAWMTGVWVFAASWGLLWWVATPPTGPPGPASTVTLATFLDVSAVLAIGGSVVVSWTQAAVRRSWADTGRTRAHGPSWKVGLRPCGDHDEAELRRPTRWLAIRVVAGLALVLAGGGLGWAVASAGAWWAAAMTTLCVLFVVVRLAAPRRLG